MMVSLVIEVQVKDSGSRYIVQNRRKEKESGENTDEIFWRYVWSSFLIVGPNL